MRLYAYYIYGKSFCFGCVLIERLRNESILDHNDGKRNDYKNFAYQSRLSKCSVETQDKTHFLDSISKNSQLPQIQQHLNTGKFNVQSTPNTNA